MQYNGSKWVNAAVSSGSSALNSLTDFAITNEANGDILVWNSSTSKYVNSSIVSGTILTNSLINLKGNSYNWQISNDSRC